MILKLRKNTGCLLEAMVFDNGITVACWQTDIPEVAVYPSFEQFLRVRTKSRGYEIIAEKVLNMETKEMKEIKIDEVKLKEAIWEVLNKENFPKDLVEEDVTEIVTRYLKKIQK